MRSVLQLAGVVLVLSVGWVWGGSAGAALCFLWWRTPSFANAWRSPVPALIGFNVDASSLAAGASWLCPWFMLRRPLSEVSASHKPNRPAFEMIYRDEVGAAEFARLRREWLGRTD